MSPKAHLDRSNPCIYGMKRQIIPLLSPWKGCFPPPPPPPPTFRQVMVFWNPSTLLGGEKPRLLKIPYMIRNTHNVRILHRNVVQPYIAVINRRNLRQLPPRFISERINTLLESSQSMKRRIPSKIITLLGSLIKVTLWWNRE